MVYFNLHTELKSILLLLWQMSNNSDPLKKTRTCGFILKMVPKVASFEVSDAYTVSHRSSTDIFLIEKISLIYSMPILPTPAAPFPSLTALPIILATITCGLP